MKETISDTRFIARQTMTRISDSESANHTDLKTKMVEYVCQIQPHYANRKRSHPARSAGLTTPLSLIPIRKGEKD